jgi:hypothetical protein
MSHPAVWPWALGSAQGREFSRALGRIVRHTQGLPLLGWEASIRLSPGQVRPNRLLLGFSPQGVADQRVLGLPAALGMPLPAVRAFERYGLSARSILLAAEMGRSGIELKAYLQFDPALPAPVPGLLMRGYKWHPASGADAAAALPVLPVLPVRVSDYFPLPSATPDATALLRLRAGVPERAHPAYALAEQALARALARHPAGLQTDVWVVSEQDSPRASHCIRLHGSGLRLADLWPGLEALGSAWSLQDRLTPDVLKSMGPRPLGWIAAGLDGQGDPFVTLYCEASRSDAWQVMTLGEMYEQK